MPLGRIKFKLWFFNVTILFFVILTNFFLFEPGCMIYDTRPIKIKELYAKYKGLPG
jgi:hypothetical protein